MNTINAIKLAAERAGTDEATLQNAINEHKKIEEQSRKIASQVEDLIWKVFDLKSLNVNPNSFEEYLKAISTAAQAVNDAGTFARNNQ